MPNDDDAEAIIIIILKRARHASRSPSHVWWIVRKLLHDVGRQQSRKNVDSRELSGLCVLFWRDAVDRKFTVTVKLRTKWRKDVPA